MTKITMLTAAAHALRSYEHGNAAPDLAREVAGAIETTLGGDAFVVSNVVDILRTLVYRFRWRNQGYEKVICPSCGAVAIRAADDYTRVQRVDECAVTCVWRRAEEIVK